MTFKALAKSIFSESLIGKITGIFYGWHGNYSSWADAKSKCTGYEEKRIFEKVLENSLKVKNGLIPYERDSVPFDRKIYSYPVLAALMWIAGQKQNKLKVIDFGGSLGSSYFQNSFFLNSLTGVKWCIVEQEHFVDAGKKYFENETLHFYYSIEECIAAQKSVDVVLLSGVIQYLEKPYEFFQSLISRGIKFLIIDRTFVFPDKESLKIQSVPKKIYKASYPCWILNERKIFEIVEEKYELIFDFEIAGSINVNCQHKGYFFALKN